MIPSYLLPAIEFLEQRVSAFTEAANYLRKEAALKPIDALPPAPMHSRRRPSKENPGPRSPCPFGPLLAKAILILLTAAVPSQPARAQHATPNISQIRQLAAPDSLAYVMRARLGSTATYVGLSLICPRKPDAPIEITAYFGGFPSDRRPVQLAVRDPHGNTHHFGPVVRGTPGSGFHSPRITDPLKALAFVNASLQTGSLVSNGYRSFWNRATPAKNDQARNGFIRCLKTRRQ